MKHSRYSYRLLFYCLILGLLIQSFSQALSSSADTLPVQDEPEPAVAIPSYAPQLELSLSTTKPLLAPGQTTELELMLTNHGPDEAYNLQLFLAAPPDLRYISGPNVPESGSREVRFELEHLAVGEKIAFPVVARLDGLPGEPLALHATASTLGQPPATAELTLNPASPQPEIVPLVAPGQSQALLGGRLQVSPLARTQQPASLSANLLEWHTPENRQTGLVIRFELGIQNQGETAAESLANPLELQLDLTGLLTSEEIAGGRYRLFSQAGAAESWQEVAVNEKGSTIVSFSTQQPGIFEVTEDEPPVSAWKPTYNPPGSSLFTGSATYNHPIALPPGIGGLQPSLSLNYSSRGVDQKVAPIQGSLGWSLSVIEITNSGASNMYSPTGPSCPQGCAAYSPYEYNLVLNGASHRLLPKAGVSRHGEYIALGDPSIRAVLISDTNSPNRSGEYWKIQTADGTTYRLGYYDDSELAIGPVGNAYTQNASQPRNIDFIAYSMKADTITDVYGRQIRFFYDEQCGTINNTVTCRDHTDNVASFEAEIVEVDLALKRIEYNFNGPITQTVVSITNDTINDTLLPTSQMLVSNFRPSLITIKQDNVEVSEYALGYWTDVDVYGGGGGDMDYHHWWLTNINQYGKGGAGVGPALPTTRFYYGFQTYGGESALLTGVNNDLGGHTWLDYDQVTAPAPNNGAFYFVDQIATWDGVRYLWDRITPANNTIPGSRTTYVYDPEDACFDHEDTPGCVVPGTDPDYPSYALAGFAQVIAKQQDGNVSPTTLGQQKTTFNVDEYHLNGQVTSVQQQDPSNNFTWSEVVNDWQWWNGRQARLLRTDRYTYQPGQAGMTLHTYETYEYDDTNNPYGGLWRKSEFDEDGNSYRCSENIYAHQVVTNGVWLVNRPLRQTLYPTNCLTYANRVAETRYRYDGSTDPADVDLNGKAQLEWTLTWDGLNHVSERRTYYASGLLEKVITYRDLSTTTPVAAYASDVLSTMHITAYSAMGLPTATQTSGSGIDTRTQSTSYDTDFDWLPASTTDANGLVTSYDFDDLGRLLTLTKPLATNPSVQYVYSLTSPPTMGTPAIRIETRVEPQTANYKSVEFYNGIGQLVQSSDLNRNVDPAGLRDVIVQTDYDPLGRAVCQSAPFANATGGAFVSSPTCTGRDRSTITYDLLGRTIEVRQPDGTKSYTSYDLWRQVATDPTFQPQASEQDAFGRLMSRGEPNWGYEADDSPMLYTGTRITNDSAASNSDSVKLAINTGQRVYGPFMDDLVANREYLVVFRVKADARPDQNVLRLIVSDKDMSGSNIVERVNRPVNGRAFLAANTYQDFVVRFTALSSRKDWEFRVEATNPSGANVWVDRITVLPITSYAYDIRDNLTDVWDAEGNNIDMAYNNLGRKTSMNDPDMGTWLYSYNQAGSLVRQTDADPSAITFVYDGLNRLVGKSLPYANSTTYSLYRYDTAQYGVGQPAEINTYGATLTDYFTSLDLNLWSTSGSVVLNGSLVELTKTGSNAILNRDHDALTTGTAARFDFSLSDVTNWSAELELTNAGSYQWELAVQNNMFKARYRENNVYSTPVNLMAAKANTWYSAALAVSENGRLTLHIWERDNPQASASYSKQLDSSQNYHFQYTVMAGVGKLDNYQEMSWTTHDVFAYDDHSRPTSQTRTIDGQTFTMQTLTYDALDRPLTVKYPDNEVVTMSYDREGENSLDAGSDDLVNNILYNERSQMTFLDRGTANVADTTYIYYGASGSGNSNFRLQTIQHGGVFDTLPNFTYTYDLLGNIDSIAAYTYNGSGQTDTQSFDYDALGRLTFAQATGGVANYGPINYTYDLLGNIKTITQNSTTTTYYYTPAQHSHSQPHAVKSFTGATGDFDYDKNGNMIGRTDGTGTYNQTFDTENRLTQVSKGSDTTSFSYDDSGQRVRTVLPNNTFIYYPFPNYEKEIRPEIWNDLTVPDAGFETSGWTTNRIFPGTTTWYGTSNAGAPHGQSKAMVLSNLASGASHSSLVTVTPNSTYNVSAWVKGELNASAGADQVMLQVVPHNNGVPGTAITVWFSSNLNNNNWQQVSGSVNIPSNMNQAQVRLVANQINGWIVFDDLSLKLGAGANILPDPSFESGSWTAVPDTNFPATSIWRGNSGPAVPAHQGSFGMMLSNLVHSEIASPMMPVSNAVQTVQVWLRGEVDGANSGGQVSIIIDYFTVAGPFTSFDEAVTVWQATTYNNLTWQQITAGGNRPTGSTHMRIRLSNAFNNGWMAFDQVTLLDGLTIITVPDSGFESGGSWTVNNHASFPAGTAWRGAGTGYQGQYAYTLSNEAYGTVTSGSIAVGANQLLELKSWIRGEMNSQAGFGNGGLRACFYNSQGGSLGCQSPDAWSSGSYNNTTWAQQGGQFTTPANTASMKVVLEAGRINGWLAFDDLTLRRRDEVAATILRRSYSLAGQAVATRVSGDTNAANNGLFFSFTDHLGSTSLLTNNSGTVQANTTSRYLPFGGFRTTPTQAITDQGYTGHKHNNLPANDLGLIYMNARYYVPGIGRFASADVTIPAPKNPQAFNRYSYVLNNPLFYNDPTGFYSCVAGENGATDEEIQNCQTQMASMLEMLRSGGGDVAYGLYIWFMMLDEQLMAGGGLGVLIRIDDLQGAYMTSTTSCVNNYCAETIGIDRSTMLNQNAGFYHAGILGHEITHAYQRTNGFGPRDEPSNYIISAETGAFYVEHMLFDEFYESGSISEAEHQSFAGESFAIYGIVSNIGRVTTSGDIFSSNDFVGLQQALKQMGYRDSAGNGPPLVHFPGDRALIVSTANYFQMLGGLARAAEHFDG